MASMQRLRSPGDDDPRFDDVGNGHGHMTTAHDRRRRTVNPNPAIIQPFIRDPSTPLPPLTCLSAQPCTEPHDPNSAAPPTPPLPPPSPPPSNQPPTPIDPISRIADVLSGMLSQPISIPAAGQPTVVPTQSVAGGTNRVGIFIIMAGIGIIGYVYYKHKHHAIQ